MTVVISGRALATLTVISLSVPPVTSRIVLVSPVFRFYGAIESLLERAVLGHLGRGKELDGRTAIAAFFIGDFPFLGVFNEAGLSFGCRGGESFWVGPSGMLVC